MRSFVTAQNNASQEARFEAMKQQVAGIEEAMKAFSPENLTTKIGTALEPIITSMQVKLAMVEKDVGKPTINKADDDWSDYDLNAMMEA